MKQFAGRIRARRFTALLLCLCIMTSMLVTGFMNYAVSGATAEDIIANRKSDADTMDDYIDKLLNDLNGSRYAGRVWTDKTVFAFGETNGDWDGARLQLKKLFDGYEGQITSYADFLHVFSALTSTQLVNEYPPSPIDLVIVFDMSGSMGQDTRYSIDTGSNGYVRHTTAGEAETWPEGGVEMSDRIAHSRVQATLNAINKTITTLMRQNPQNRVAVVGYGASATVLMPLAHWQLDENVKNDSNSVQTFLSVGGMETLLYPGDLEARYDGAAGAYKWYWINNRDTAYTVQIEGEMNESTDGRLGEGTVWKKVSRTVSNNVKGRANVQNSAGETIDATVRAFPGVSVQTEGTLAQSAQKFVEDKYAVKLQRYNSSVMNSDDDDKKKDSNLAVAEIVKNSYRMEADEYVGYLTNTQGGIYLGYKQLADSKVTTYSETLSTGKYATVARIPAAVIMSDGGANFTMNPMGVVQKPDDIDDAMWWQMVGREETKGKLDLSQYSIEYLNYAEWTETGKKDGDKDAESAFGDVGYNDSGKIVYPQDAWNVFSALRRYYELPGNIGDEWHNVWLPTPDAFSDITGYDDESFYGLPSLYNPGADQYCNGTLMNTPSSNYVGVLYSNDNNLAGTAGATLEVLLTASYMSGVVEKYYQNGWTAANATVEKQTGLSTYTMNVDSENVPQWGRWRLYPSLDPAGNALDDIKIDDASSWVEDAKRLGTKFGAESFDGTGNIYHDSVFSGLSDAWNSFKEGSARVSVAAHGSKGEPKITIAQSSDGYRYAVGDGSAVNLTNADVVNNIAYNDAFYDVTSKDLDNIFSTILNEILGQVFVPITGGNDAGVDNSLIYQDPLGDYMQLKNQSITATPFHRDANGGNSLKGATETTYDMAMLLFGEMHGLTRAGVYDFQWNETFMKTHAKQLGLDPDKSPMQVGWYRGDDPTKSLTEYKSQSDSIPNQKDRPSNTVEYVSSEDMSKKHVGENKEYADLNAVWDNGWVLRLSYQDLINYVPIVNAKVIEGKPLAEQLPDSVKYTTYTLYRFSCTQDDRNQLRMNPVYGNSVPQDVQERWDQYHASYGAYPETNDIYEDTPGVYRLSDIRVWLEEYGDYKDNNGNITPNSNVYDASVYCNVPVAALPTQVAEITLGSDGVANYKTNVVDTNGKEDTGVTEDDMKKLIQSTPLRLFYGVGLSDDLIITDEAGNQVGVDVAKISAEYIESHTVNNENGASQGRIYFLSNYYSATNYEGYATDDTSRTRGDPTVSFSPGESNRYYVFQKPLPLYAHAYRVTGTTDNPALSAVDKKNGGANAWNNGDNRAGNGAEYNQWEEYGDKQQDPGSWAGGYYIGVYEDEAAFQQAMKTAEQAEGSSNVVIITDANGDKYKVWKDKLNEAIAFLEADRLDHVTSDPANGGYENGSVSFSSDDWFFLPVDFYVPNGEDGVDLEGKKVEGASGADAVQYVVTRKGSEFGSGLHAKNISNGDMLCWIDINGKLNIPFEYNSRTETGDNTRGEPTYDLIFGGPSNGDLQEYLKGELEEQGITNDGKGEIVVRDADGNPAKNDDGTVKTAPPLDAAVAYWTAVRVKYADILSKLKAEYTTWKEKQDGQNDTEQDWFKETFRFTVAAKPGGLRTGDMAQNRGAKGDSRLADTAYNYYLPTISENSGIGADTVINNYLGNNGRLEIYNQELLVTKTVVPPAGKNQIPGGAADREFFYQVYIQNAGGDRSAIVAAYNEYAKVWQRKLGTVDILTDNSDLLLDSSGSRVLFDFDDSGAKMVAAVGTNGETKYYYANEDGTPSEVPCKKSESDLYYVYIPQNTQGVSGSDHSRCVYVDPDLEGDKGGKLENAGRTTYVPTGETVPEEKIPDGDKLFVTESYAAETENRTAGTREYWVNNAELIPVSEVREAEGTMANLESLPGGDEPVFSLTAAEMAEETLQWSHSTEDCEGSHQKLDSLTVLIRKPTDNSDVGGKDTIISPYQIRTQYLTRTLHFGVNSNADGDGKNTSSESLVWPTDFYGGELIGNSQQVNHVAEFTLKSGEGLVFSGLSSTDYRFTEKLTDTDIQDGYVLDRIQYITDSTGNAKEFTPADNDDEDAGYKHTGNAYSVKGKLEEFEDQVHYINTVAPDILVLQKLMEDSKGNAVASPPSTKFQFTLQFANTDSSLLPDPLYYRITTEYKLNTVPRRLEYNADGNVITEGLQTLTKGGDGTYTIELAAGEIAVFYDLYPGTAYTITEQEDPTYTLKEIQPSEGAEQYQFKGTIQRNGDDVSLSADAFQNKVKFVNLLPPGTLTVQKKILGDEPDPAKQFGFTVTLRSTDIQKPLTEPDLEAITAEKFTKDGTAGESVSLEWKENNDGSWTAAFTLGHDEKVIIHDIPLDTEYTVTETQRDGYQLQHVADNADDRPNVDTDSYLEIEADGVTGRLTEENANDYMLFANAKASYLPFTGSFGLWGILGGILLAGLLGTAAYALSRRKRGAHAK